MNDGSALWPKRWSWWRMQPYHSQKYSWEIIRGMMEGASCFLSSLGYDRQRVAVVAPSKAELSCRQSPALPLLTYFSGWARHYHPVHVYLVSSSLGLYQLDAGAPYSLHLWWHELAPDSTLMASLQDPVALHVVEMFCLEEEAVMAGTMFGNLLVPRKEVNEERDMPQWPLGCFKSYMSHSFSHQSPKTCYTGVTVAPCADEEEGGRAEWEPQPTHLGEVWGPQVGIFLSSWLCPMGLSSVSPFVHLT